MKDYTLYKAACSYPPHLTNEEWFLAGREAPPGIYRQVGGQREIHLEEQGLLPATCDGHVGIYVRYSSNLPETHQLCEEE